MKKDKKNNQQAIGATHNKSNISQTQFFLLFCLCFFMPTTVLLPDLMSKNSNNLAWVSVIIGTVVIVALFYILHLVFKADGKGLSEKSITILGKPLGVVLCIFMTLFSLFLASFYARHFAERVLLVYITDTNVITIIFSLMVAVLVVLSSGVLSFARLCEILFYIFVATFVLVTIAGLFDGVKLDNLWGVQASDTKGILLAGLYMLLPFCIFICMAFFGERVNWRGGLIKQGAKVSVFLGMSTVAVIVLCVGSLGVFGTQYLQMPYFTVTRQIDYLGPMKNIGSIVFSMWIVCDLAIVSTLCYSGAGVMQSLTHTKHRKIPIYVSVIIVFFVAVFAYPDMTMLNWFFDRIVVPVCIAVSITIPLLLLIVGLSRRKIKFFNNIDIQPKDSESNIDMKPNIDMKQNIDINESENTL